MSYNGLTPAIDPYIDRTAYDVSSQYFNYNDYYSAIANKNKTPNLLNKNPLTILEEQLRPGCVPPIPAIPWKM